MDKIEQREQLEAQMREAVKTWEPSTLITYHASAVRRLAEDPTRGDREDLILEQNVIADELQRRLEA